MSLVWALASTPIALTLSGERRVRARYRETEWAAVGYGHKAAALALHTLGCEPGTVLGGFMLEAKTPETTDSLGEARIFYKCQHTNLMTCDAFSKENGREREKLQGAATPRSRRR